MNRANRIDILGRVSALMVEGIRIRSLRLSGDQAEAARRAAALKPQILKVRADADLHGDEAQRLSIAASTLSLFCVAHRTADDVLVEMCEALHEATPEALGR